MVGDGFSWLPQFSVGYTTVVVGSGKAGAKPEGLTEIINGQLIFFS